MDKILVALCLVILCFVIAPLAYKLFAFILRQEEGYKSWKSGGRRRFSDILKSWNEEIQKSKEASIRRSPSLKFEEEAIIWCANLLETDKEDLRRVLETIPAQYCHFWMAKRSGGYRMISAPRTQLKSYQETIYRRILLPANVHPAATGFRPGQSIADNASPHLGNSRVLKTDIHDFFGSIRSKRVRKAFEEIGYPKHVSKVLGTLCCTAKRKLPQGAPTSPALSNIVACSMDRKLAKLAHENDLTYSRYADDLTFSGNHFTANELLPRIEGIVNVSGFRLNRKKTRFMNDGKRKIITGVSISSGVKLTIPKARKREIRKRVHFILTKGLAEHQRYVGSTDPAYLKRLIGMLCYWRSIEPENCYVADSIEALKRLEIRS